MLTGRFSPLAGVPDGHRRDRRIRSFTVCLPENSWSYAAPKSHPPTPTPHSSEGAGGPRVSEFYRNYLAVAVFVGAALLMVGAMLGVGRLVRPSRPRTEKLLPYEAGSDAMLEFGQSNVRYYIYALLFVMFDVEAVFIFPWAVDLERLGTFGLVEMVVFIAILTLGLVYAWRKGVLRWA